MKALIALLLIAGACVLPTAGAAEPDSLPQATDWKFQFGAGYRLGGERYNWANSVDLLVTTDVSWSHMRESQPVWGVGLHAAFSNDGGPRFAPRLHWRAPLGAGPRFLQASAGVYLLAIDKEMNAGLLGRLDLPGYLFELEFGANEAFSIVATAESLPVDLFENGLGCDSDCTESTAPIAGAIIRNYSFGAKFAGRDAPAIAVIMLVGAALYAAMELASW
jgi:hypothetical protein